MSQPFLFPEVCVRECMSEEERALSLQDVQELCDQQGPQVCVEAYQGADRHDQRNDGQVSGRCALHSGPGYGDLPNCWHLLCGMGPSFRNVFLCLCDNGKWLCRDAFGKRARGIRPLDWEVPKKGRTCHVDALVSAMRGAVVAERR